MTVLLQGIAASTWHHLQRERVLADPVITPAIPSKEGQLGLADGPRLIADYVALPHGETNWFAHAAEHLDQRIDRELRRLLVKDLGGKADTRKLAKAAANYEVAVVRRLGYLLEQTGHAKPARALRVYADSAKHFAPLDPGFRPVVAALIEPSPREPTWKLDLNEVVEVDA